MSIENNTLASQFQNYEVFLPEANKVSDQLEDKRPTAPIIKDLESLGLVALFKSLSGE